MIQLCGSNECVRARVCVFSATDCGKAETEGYTLLPKQQAKASYCEVDSPTGDNLSCFKHGITI